MEDLFSIGEISRYQHISKQTLIFYDKIGLFHPAYVDPHNGYRYYSAQQLDLLDTILILKKMGFSLADIRAHLQHYDTESSLAILKKQLTALDEQILELRLTRSRLAHRCVQIESALAHRKQDDAVTEGPVAPQCLLFRPVEPPYRLREISIATKQCFAEAFEKKLPVFFQSGVVVPLQRILAGRYTEASQAFLPIEETGQVPNVLRIPAGRCVSTFHVGDYLSIGRSYRRLLAYCEEQRLQIVSDSYEFCINDYLTTRKESEYITRIVFYVAPQEGDAGERA